MDTRESGYTDWRVAEERVWWKRLLDVQRPYREHLRGLKLGRTLEIGCGTGRNLVALGVDAVGIDHAVRAVEVARSRGAQAFTPDEFGRSTHAVPASFDALLVAHVLEHMTPAEAVELMRRWLPFVRRGGRVVVITPQEVGFRSDPTHVTYMDHARVDELLRRTGCSPIAAYSFPFPRVMGKVFKYNEFVSIAVLGEPAPAR